MTTISPTTSQTPCNVATVNALGGVQLATGGGHVAAPPVVAAAGSSDCVATLYDGTSTGGVPLATFSMAQAGPTMMPNAGYLTGLYFGNFRQPTPDSWTTAIFCAAEPA